MSDSKPFGPPFDDLDSDIVLRSRDGVNFHVHRLIVAKASSFFRDFPYEVDKGASEHMDDSEDPPPVIPLLSEDEKTVEGLLRLVCPVAPPTFGTLSDVRAVLEAGRKYGIDTVPRRVEEMLLGSSIPQAAPLATYALACAHGMESAARLAARATLGFELLQNPPKEELKAASALDYHNLCKYRKERAEAAHKPLKKGALIVLLQKNTHWVWMTCKTCETDMSLSYTVPSANIRISPKRVSARDWWAKYIKEMHDSFGNNPSWADVCRPSLVHRALERAKGCANCSQTAEKHMDEFIPAFYELVESAMSEVRCVNPARL